MAKIGLKGLRLRAQVGVTPEEQAKGNEFSVDLSVQLSVEAAAKNDRLEDTIDYTEFYQIIRDQFTPGTKLMEAVAYRVSHEMRRRWPQIEHIYIRIQKLNPPVDGDVAASFVEWEEGQATSEKSG